jgi:hypothetical protein
MPERNAKSAATKWLHENGLGWGNVKHPQSGKHAKKNTGVSTRKVRAGARTKRNFETVKAFVERHRDVKVAECVFVPHAVENRPASVKFCGRDISAARYMCLLTHGTPKSEGMYARHKCGNGHLSCVNPAHIVWGTPGDNMGDANIHRAMEGATVEDKCAAVDARTSKEYWGKLPGPVLT